mmetsp:Transcript_37770/g.67695  ORF Transcript_37770/g.67695 Transcript_37770/m.67695 type:complete len:211 (-) Transcript_37770:48-680(-)
MTQRCMIQWIPYHAALPSGRAFDEAVSTVRDANTFDDIADMQIVQHLWISHHVTKYRIVAIKDVCATGGDLRLLVEEKELGVGTVGVDIFPRHRQSAQRVERQNHLLPHQPQLLLRIPVRRLRLALVPHLHRNVARRAAGLATTLPLTRLNHKPIRSLDWHVVVEALPNEVDKISGSDGRVHPIEHRRHNKRLSRSVGVLYLYLGHRSPT